MFLGAIFDWDGVIIDSHDAHEESWERLAEEEKLPLPPNHFKQGFGRTNTQLIPDLYGWASDAAEVARLGNRKEALWRAIIAERGIAPLPGVSALLGQLNAAKIPCAIGTSTSRENIAFVLPRIGLDGCFAAVVTAEDVRQGKPDPEVFLKAAERLAQQPESCVVFEDTVFGIDAAKAGGMKAVAVTTTHPAARFAHADLVIADMSGLTVARLQALFAR